MTKLQTIALSIFVSLAAASSDSFAQKYVFEGAVPVDSSSKALSAETVAAHSQQQLSSAFSGSVDGLDSWKKSRAAFNKEETSMAKAVLASSVYYKDSRTGEALFQYLHEVTGQNASVSSYNRAKSFMVTSADRGEQDGVDGVWTAYSDVLVPGSGDNGGAFGERTDENGDGILDKAVNVEHTWPQSFFNKSNPMVADVHHLQTELLTPNSRRSNYPYGVVSKGVKYTTASGSKLGNGIFEPCDANKGATARAMLYFMVRYYDRNIRQGSFGTSFWKNNVDMLLEWNRKYPPTARERARNDMIEKFQGNRNPFVDDPTLADTIGAETFKSH